MSLFLASLVHLRRVGLWLQKLGIDTWAVRDILSFFGRGGGGGVGDEEEGVVKIIFGATSVSEYPSAYGKMGSRLIGNLNEFKSLMKTKIRIKFSELQIV